ncbi:MAG: SPL family radical SAM protein [Planctomycetota bacterium]|jgi:DNA repair photolyase
MAWILSITKEEAMLGLFEESGSYSPVAADYFKPRTIILTKGWNRSSIQAARAKAICGVYPHVRVLNMPDVSHSQVDLKQSDLLSTHCRGKQTLVLGVHNSAVRFSRERGNTCPNYWHFSPYGFCPYDCKYCYLAGTPGVKFSPTVKIFLNIDQILGQISRTASTLTEPAAFYLGKLQDGLALDSLTGYSRIMVPFFAGQKHARLVLLTKCDRVENLLDLEHGGHTLLSWSLNPPEVSRMFESNVPSIPSRVAAMKKCSEAGFPIRVVVMPIIPVEGWRQIYSDFLTFLLSNVKLERMSLGQICSYTTALQLTNQKLGPGNPIAAQLQKVKSPDGRLRFPTELRIEVYEHLAKTIKELQPGLQIALCLEEQNIVDAVRMNSSVGHCNCVL